MESYCELCGNIIKGEYKYGKFDENFIFLIGLLLKYDKNRIEIMKSVNEFLVDFL